MKSGFVSVIGRPNVGKSTLINNLIGFNIAITSNKPQTTRNNIHGIYNEEDTQIVFVDTPGIHKPNHELGSFLNKQAYLSIDEVDVVLFMVDGSEDLGGGDKFILNKLENIDKPVILLINKIDKIKDTELILKIEEYKDLYDFKEIIPVSGLKKSNTKTLIKVLKTYLPDNVQYYEDGEITNRSTNFLIGELVREKVLRETFEEIPHAVTTLVEDVEMKKGAAYIRVLIIVERPSIKGIIIGKQGEMIKKIGTLARKDIEVLLGKKVYLELFVKVVKKWRNDSRRLEEFGYHE